MDDKGNVLVVGAKTAAGRAYTKALSEAGYRVWAVALPLEDPAPLLAAGARPAPVNLLDPATVHRAVADTTALVIALTGDTGGIGGTEDLVTARFVEAARSEHVHHIVYSSALDADASSLIAHLRQRALLEERIVESGLPFTVLRPAPLMEALSDGPLGAKIQQSGVIESPVSGDTPISYVAARDLGRFAVLALEDGELNCETVEVGGPEPVTLRGLLPWVSRVFRRPMTYREIPLRKLKHRLGTHGMQLIAHMNRHGYHADMAPLIPRLHPPLKDIHTFLLEAWRQAGLEVSPLETADRHVQAMSSDGRAAEAA